MADKQLGNVHSVTDAQEVSDKLGRDNRLANVTADGANSVTVDSTDLIRAGMTIDIVTVADGTVVADSRTVTEVHSDGTVVYDGADVAATANEALYLEDTYGLDERSGFVDFDLVTIQDMRERLKTIDAGYYTDDRLNNMTLNDMVYAIRRNDFATSIKE